MTPSKLALQRLSTAQVRLSKVALDVSYTTEGTYMPATETDPAERPIAVVRAVWAGDRDITALMSDEQIAEIAELVERTFLSEEPQCE